MLRASLRLVVLVVAVAAGLALPAAAQATVRGSVEQVQVTDARAGVRATLVDARGDRVATRRVGRLGTALFRDVRPGSGYRVRGAGAGEERVRVLSTRATPPSTSGYRQELPRSGYGYLETRDGTDLAINVRLPAGRGDGPFPTLIEYSGYGYARDPSGESSIAQIATLLGFAVVDVNMRGTGCSGGAFDYFERLQALDGYDVVETVARQPWAAHGKVGMMGVSYGGISQLFVAATRPPSLAAIAPLSVIDDTQTTLYPGGILNTGFALSWAKDRVHDARPASSTGGQAWALDRIRGGDERCARNQALHEQAVDLLAKTRANRFYDPDVADPLAPRTLVDRIRAPTFLACQFTDEQTGGSCPTLASRFTGTRRAWFTFTNGTHIDSLDPATFTRWYDFLSIYVARRRPRLADDVRGLAPEVFRAAMGIPGVTLPEDPIQAEPTLRSARRAFERLPRVRVLFDNGDGRADAVGAPYAGFERTFPRLPAPGTRARTFLLGPGGTLGRARRGGGSRSFRWDPRAAPRTSFTGETDAGDLWTATPGYRWARRPAGAEATFTTAALGKDAVVLGGGALTAWVRSSAGSPDLQATVSEVRPDGRETFVQSGWLRGTGRALDRRRSTTLAPVLSLRRRDAAPWPAGRFVRVTIPLYQQGHAYRRGSRIRVTVAAPGGDQPVWAFDEPRRRAARRVSIAFSSRHPSRLVLPEVPGVDVPTPLPRCRGLRGQPCRASR